MKKYLKTLYVTAVALSTSFAVYSASLNSPQNLDTTLVVGNTSGQSATVDTITATNRVYVGAGYGTGGGALIQTDGTLYTKGSIFMEGVSLILDNQYATDANIYGGVSSSKCLRLFRNGSDAYPYIRLDNAINLSAKNSFGVNINMQGTPNANFANGGITFHAPFNIGTGGTAYDANFYSTAASGTRMFWDEDRGTLRAGRDSTGTSWVPGSTGLYSFCSGTDCICSGQNSYSLGNKVTASGNFSLAFGQNVTAGPALNAMAIGHGVDSTTNRIVNNTADSLVVGFNSNMATLYVGPSSGVGTTGNVGVGTTTVPDKLTVNGNISDGTYRYPVAGTSAERIQRGAADIAVATTTVSFSVAFFSSPTVVFTPVVSSSDVDSCNLVSVSAGNFSARCETATQTVQWIAIGVK